MTTLDTSFLRAIVLLTAFKDAPMQNAQAALLLIGLEGGDFTSAELPGEVTNGSKHLAGAATGALVALGLIECVGYSPTEIKKHMAGKGNADKAAMVKACRAKFPHIELTSSDEADALAILCLHMSRQKAQ